MKVKEENYIVVPGHARTRFGLKGNELLVYGLLYGFSQDGESWFTGSASYIAEWVGTSKNTVYKVLKSLVEKGVVEKREKTVNGVALCDYRTKNLATPPKKLGYPTQKTGHQRLEERLEEERDELSGSQANADAAPEKAGTKDSPASEVIRRLNEKAGTAFREGSKQSARLIDARLREGYTVGELESIVDAMCEEWGGDPRMRDYLRPSTLFNATNAENYLEKARRAAESRSKARKAPTAKADRGSTEEARKSALKAAREWASTHGLPASSVCGTMAVDGIAVLGADGNSLVKVFRY